MTSVVESQKKYRVNSASTSTKSDRLLGTGIVAEDVSLWSLSVGY